MPTSKDREYHPDRYRYAPPASPPAPKAPPKPRAPRKPRKRT